jgi:hypothetical protein
MSEQQNIKEVIKQEFLKCAKDPVYFMKKYYWIQHPQRGRIQFNLYPFQEKVLHQLRNNEYTIINKSRQLGISTLSSAYTLWLMLFHQDKNILCIATKQETAKNMVTKVRFAYGHLPSWLKVKATEDNKLSLKLGNGSQIKAVGATSDAGRSEAVSLLLLDEAAFIPGIDDIFTAAQQTLATGGQCIAISTPNGTGNWFHKTFTKAQIGENKFLPLNLPWTVHPERNQAWRDQQDKELGVRDAAQECDCDFSTSGNTVVEPTILNKHEVNVEEPMEKRYLDRNLWVWEPPDYSRSYVLVADVARGDGKDYSAFHIIDTETVTQVAEYKGQLGTRDYANLLVNAATEYNDALLVVENANIGWDVIQSILERDYKNFYYSPRSTEAFTSADAFLSKYENGTGMVPGFTNNQRVRPLAVAKMISYMNDGTCVIKSARLLEELRTFIWMNGKAQAQHNYNDDLVMAWCIGLYLRDTSLTFMQTGIDSARASLSAMGSRSGLPAVPSIGRGDYGQQNPWQMTDSQGNINDISWLI